MFHCNRFQPTGTTTQAKFKAYKTIPFTLKSEEYTSSRSINLKCRRSHAHNTIFRLPTHHQCVSVVVPLHEGGMHHWNHIQSSLISTIHIWDNVCSVVVVALFKFSWPSQYIPIVVTICKAGVGWTYIHTNQLSTCEAWVGWTQERARQTSMSVDYVLLSEDIISISELVELRHLSGRQGKLGWGEGKPVK